MNEQIVLAGCESDAAPQRDGLSPWQVYRAYARGADLRGKPAMLEKMLARGCHFSWCAFVFGPLYYFYRKQWKAGVIYFAALVALDLLALAIRATDATLAIPGIFFLSTAVLHFIVGCVSFAGSLAMCFAFYPIYRSSAEREYEKWASLDGNRPDDMASAIRHLERAGGVSWAGVAIMLALNLAAAPPNLLYRDAADQLEKEMTYSAAQELLKNDSFMQLTESAVRETNRSAFNEGHPEPMPDEANPE